VDEDGQKTCPKRRTLLVLYEQYNGKKNGDTHDLMFSRKKHCPIIKLGSIFHS